ncbi:serine/threonine-protein kinase [Sphaerisporangium sp. NPDC005289]|uniref:serine/threonine-protein kinase n=1 Tax=Sphaerisporangium sp. NPDC005289 TaxID=3155247 RepID=UPI0033BD3867
MAIEERRAVPNRRTTIAERYELDPLSRRSGGMGEIWFGRDKRLDRPVAVKFIRVDRMPDGRPDEELTKRFVRESRITAALEHPGVPTVYDCGSFGDDLYMVMQLIDGCSLADLLDEIREDGEIPIAWAAAIAAQVCSVLSAAHARSLVHRDLKPGNLMLCRDGTVKVLDFGVAAALSSTETRLTRTGMALGTPEYMAPEQAAAGTVEPRTDLYSLAVVLDEMLAKHNQFKGDTALASMRNHTDRAPRPLRGRRPEVPEGLERLVLRMLAKNPEERPASADEVYAGLLEFCAEPPPFPGYVDLATAYPTRMYAKIVGRVEPPGPASAAERGGTARSPAPEEIADARKRAEKLKAASRFGEAAEVLSELLQAGAATLGPRHLVMIEIRIELADVLFLGGDYRRAVPLFRELAADLTAAKGPSDDLVLRCRLMEGHCHAVVGETDLALAQFRRLLDDERELGVDEERVLELRRQIGLLELGTGNRAAARRTLTGLLPDLESRYGPHHPNVAKVRETLRNLGAE